jgi:hypothetical protein
MEIKINMFRLFDTIKKTRFFIEVDEDKYANFMIDSKDNVYYISYGGQSHLNKYINIEWGNTICLKGFKKINLYENDKVQIGKENYFVKKNENGLFCFIEEYNRHFFYFHEINTDLEVKIIGVKEI